jgi:cell division protein FtsB
MRRILRGGGWAGAIAWASGCGGAAAPGAADPSEVQRVAPLTVAAYPTEELLGELDRARALALVEKHDEAARILDRLRQRATDPGLLALGTYHAGLAYEGLGQRETALARYREIGERWPEQPIAKNALVRTCRLLGYLERWSELERAAEKLLAIGETLPEMDRIEGLGAKALALVEQGRADEAERWANKGRAIVEERGFGRAGAPPLQLAQLSFAEGEILRLRGEAIRLAPPPPSFAEVLERRCQALLDAQAAYTDAMRAGDPYWSTTSGYRVGELYHQLHRELMQIAPPLKADTAERKQLFEAAMRLRYRILLEKGLRMMASTLGLAARSGESSAWVMRAERAKIELERALTDEKAALAKLPYTEDELRAALDKLKTQTTGAPAEAPRAPR